jgi:DNA polymerase-3 subunit chi
VQVDFYHLVASPLDSVLPRIAERVVDGGGRLLVVGDDHGLLTRLDAHLWKYAPASFLPHGLVGGERDGDQPVLLATTADAPANGARNVAIVDGVWRDAALGFDRAFHFFDEEAIEEARGAWRDLADRDQVERRYWKQDDDGRWAQMA